MDENLYRDRLSVSGIIKGGKNTGMLNFPKVPGYYDYAQLQRRNAKPFYMLAAQMNDERSLLQDLDYLKRMYPEIVRGYMDQISETLDKLDYEGSMIYDEYPDTEHLKRLSRTIVAIIRQKENTREGKGFEPRPMVGMAPMQTVPPMTDIPMPPTEDISMPNGEPAPGMLTRPVPEMMTPPMNMPPEEMVGTDPSEDKWIWVEYLVRILLSLEIFRRRNRKSRYY